MDDIFKNLAKLRYDELQKQLDNKVTDLLLSNDPRRRMYGRMVSCIEGHIIPMIEDEARRFKNREDVMAFAFNYVELFTGCLGSYLADKIVPSKIEALANDLSKEFAEEFIAAVKGIMRLPR